MKYIGWIYIRLQREMPITGVYFEYIVGQLYWKQVQLPFVGIVFCFRIYQAKIRNGYAQQPDFLFFDQQVVHRRLIRRKE